jgi:hypothetical protein
MHGVMQTLEDIPSEFFGGVLASKKQQYHLHRLPNLFPTLPTLHKFVERYVTTSELNAREGTYVVVAALGSVRRAMRNAVGMAASASDSPACRLQHARVLHVGPRYRQVSRAPDISVVRRALLCRA